MNIRYGHTLSGVALDTVPSHFLGFISGVVQHLHIEKLGGVIESRDGLDETFEHVALVVNGQLNGDARPLGNRGRLRGNIFRVRVVVVTQPIAVQAIQRQDEKHDEVGNHHCQVEAIGVVNARKGAIGDFVPVMAERTLRGQQRYERWSLHDSLYTGLLSGSQARPEGIIIVQNWSETWLREGEKIR